MTEAEKLAIVREFMEKLSHYAELKGWKYSTSFETEDNGITWETNGYDQWDDNWGASIPNNILAMTRDEITAHVAAEKEAKRIAREKSEAEAAEQARIQNEKRAAAQEQADRAKLAELKAKYPDD